MSSYYEKREAARLKIESGKMDFRQDPQGNKIEEKPYHVMYSDGFPGYFIYMVLCDFGELDDTRQSTPWGFDYYETEQYSPYYREPPAAYEYCLVSAEVEAWLDKYYGNLPDADDYKYLISILETAYNSSGESFTHTEYNKALALKWLNDKVEHAESVSSKLSLEDLGGQWNFSNAEFVELVYALVLSGAITLTRAGGKKGLIERLGKALSVKEISNISVTVNAIRTKRNNDRASPLLDKLKISFMKWWQQDE